MSMTVDALEELKEREYQWGFVTDIESDVIPRGLNEETIRLISAKKNEPPFMLEGNEERLEEGMVFSVEPGIYLPGRFGVRLEVIASVAPDGVSLINAPRVGELPVSTG